MLTVRFKQSSTLINNNDHQTTVHNSHTDSLIMISKTSSRPAKSVQLLQR